MLKNLRCVKINSVNYGEVIIYPSKLSKVCNGYYVTVTIDGKEISGVVDKDYNEVICLQEGYIDYCHMTHDKRHGYVAIKHPNNNLLEYYILKTTDDGICKYVRKLDIDNNPPIELLPIKNNDKFWIISTIEEEPVYSLYNIYKDKVVTIPLNELVSMDIDKNNKHRFYYSINIEHTDVKDEVERKITHSNFCGFLDNDGKLSSDILETNNLLYYPANFYGPDTLSEKFIYLVSSITQKYKKEFLEKEDLVDEAINQLYNSDSPVFVENNYDKPAKILKFDRKERKCNNEKK